MRSRVPSPVQCGAQSRAEQARESCRAALEAPAMLAVGQMLTAAGRSVKDGTALIAQVGDAAPTQTAVSEFARSLPGADRQPEGAVERFLALHTILEHLDRVKQLPVAAGVKALFYDEFARFAADESTSEWCRAGAFSFIVLCKKASLRIFPAGELYWEVSGFPRSWLSHIPLASLPKALHFFATRFRGFRPAFYFHLDPGRKNRILSPVELDRSYYLMAKSLELQPEAKGILTVGWLHSPDTHRVSPHLAWRNKIFEENRGFIGTIKGPVDLNLVFHRSPERRKLYEQGKFKPTNGLILWAREDMRAWAAAHPELDPGYSS